MFWNDRQRLYEIARGVRGFGWLLAILILVVGAVSATVDGEMGLLIRALWAAAVLAVATAAAWLIDRYAERAATR